MTTRAGVALFAMVMSVLVLADGATAQVELKAPPVPVPERLREPLVISPGDSRDVSRPSDADFYRETPRVRHAPAFLAPLSKRTATGRAGVAGWISPNTPTGARVSTQEEAGWFGFGFALEWGGPGEPEGQRPR